MLFSTSFIQSSLSIFTMNSTIKSGNCSTLKKSVTFVTPEFKALTNFLIILILREDFDKVKIDRKVFFLIFFF